jgi:hypothetical protein
MLQLKSVEIIDSVRPGICRALSLERSEALKS